MSRIVAGSSDFLSDAEFNALLNAQPVINPKDLQFQDLLDSIFLPKNIPTFPTSVPDNTLVDFTPTEPQVETRGGADDAGLTHFAGLIPDFFGGKSAGGLVVPIVAVGLIAFGLLTLGKS